MAFIPVTMNRLPCVAMLGLSLASAVAEVRTFTDLTGRTLEAEITTTQPGSVTLRLKTGRTFTLPLEKLSDSDRQFVTFWNAQRAQRLATVKRSLTLPASIVSWCKARIGQQVGNGECWTLADEAFKACGAKRPNNEVRVWGRLLILEKEPPQPGDIVEFRSAKFKDGSLTGPEHTAVVTKVVDKRRVTVAEQNWGWVKKVHERELVTDELVSGEMMFYRPR